jgi:hypothetical protein
MSWQTDGGSNGLTAGAPRRRAAMSILRVLLVALVLAMFVLGAMLVLGSCYPVSTST